MPSTRVTRDDWRALFTANLETTFFMSQAVAAELRRSGKPGSIVSISSISGMNTAPFHIAYGTAKAAVVAMTRTMAVELAHDNIRVNAVAPGVTETAASRTYVDEDPDRDRQAIAMGRRGTPEEQAGAILFLLSDLSSYITGQTLLVDGGLNLKWTHLGADNTSLFLKDESFRARSVGIEGGSDDRHRQPARTAAAEELSEPMTIGVEAYISEDYARAERDKLWRKVWQQVGRVEEIPEVGSYLTYDILDDSIIVVRTGPNEFAAHHNVCMHRGRRLVDTPEGAKNACGRGTQVVRLRIPRLDIRSGRRVHPHPRAGRLEGRADTAEHPPRAGQGRHLGRLAVHQHGSRLRTAGRLPVPGREDPRPVRAGEHALQVAQVAELRLQLEGRDGGLQRDLPRVHHAPGVQQVRRVQGLGQGAGQAQQHRLRRAKGHGRDQVQDPPRHRRPAHLDRGDAGLHMEETNATTTQTLVNAAKRLVDELPEGTPADKVLEHWLASARRDDEARGVIWPTIPADILGQSGTAWQIFPNFQIGQGLTSALCYSARPIRATTRTSASSRWRCSSCIPKGQEPQTEWAVHAGRRPELAVRAAAGLLQHGRGAAGHEVARLPAAPSPTRTASAAPPTCTANCRSTWAPANHREL